MKYLDEISAWIIGTFGALYSFMTGNFGVASVALAGIMALDIISGVLKGAKAKNLRSTISNLGMYKKAGILVSVIFGYVLDVLISDGQSVFTTMFIWVAIGNESLSLIENLASLGVAIPDSVKDKLGQIQDSYVSITAEKDNQLNLSNIPEQKDAQVFDSDYSVKEYLESLEGNEFPKNVLKGENNDDFEAF